MEGPVFKQLEVTADQESFKPYEGALSSDLKYKLEKSKDLYKERMSDSIASKCAALLAHASIIAANVATVATNDERYQQAA